MTEFRLHCTAYCCFMHAYGYAWVWTILLIGLRMLSACILMLFNTWRRHTLFSRKSLPLDKLCVIPLKC